MKSISVLKLWLLTVILGSFLLGFLSLFIDEYNEFKISEVLLFFSFGSLFLSIPGIFLIMMYNRKYVNKYQDINLYKKHIFLIHIKIAIVYILLGFFSKSFEVFFIFSLSILIYLIIGIQLWKYEILKQKKLTQKK